MATDPNPEQSTLRVELSVTRYSMDTMPLLSHTAARQNHCQALRDDIKKRQDFASASGRK